VLKATTFEVLLELLVDIPWQIGLLHFKLPFEPRVVLVNDLI
jgi:hypothetical protein